MRVRRATLDDSEDLFAWRNESYTRLMSRTSDVLNWESHCLWLQQTIGRSDRLILIGIDESNDKVGVVRFDIESEGTAEISINLNPEKRGMRQSVPLLRQAIQHAVSLGIMTIVAVIKKDNAASIAAFKRVGFHFVSCDNDLCLFQLEATDSH